MGIFDLFNWTGSHSNPQVRTSLTRSQLETLFQETKAEMQVRNYAIQIAINKLASALSLCKFETYKKGEVNRDVYWWKFNYEPNPNTNMHDFLYQIVYQMIWNDDGALVLQSKEGDFVVAKSFDVVESSYYPNYYQNIELYGGYTQSYAKESDVLRFQLPNKDVRKLIDDLFSTYGKFIAISTQSYIRDRSMKLILKLGTQFDQSIQVDEETGEEFNPVDELMTHRFKNLFDDGNTITPLEDGLEFDTLATTATPQNRTNSKEISDLVDKVIDLTADAFGIPRGLLKGDVADVEAMTDNFITFAVRPLAKEIETELNRKIYGRKDVLEGTKIKVITGTIQTYNIVSFAAAADKLIAASIATPNEMREALEWERLDNPLMDEIKETKNYQKLGTDKDKE